MKKRDYLSEMQAHLDTTPVVARCGPKRRCSMLDVAVKFDALSVNLFNPKQIFVGTKPSVRVMFCPFCGGAQ